MQEKLWWWAKKFSNHFSADEYRELEGIEHSLQDPSSPANREQALVFSMYQLLINGAIAEHNIQEYQNKFPDFVRARLCDEWLEQAAEEAWRGSAYAPPRSNILGSIALMVVLLFFFESSCRMELSDDDSSLKVMLGKLKSASRIDQETYQALAYLGEFRNVWHNSGFHKDTKSRCSYEPTHIQLTFSDLIPGRPVKPLTEEQSLHLLDKVLTTFCGLTRVKL